MTETEAARRRAINRIGNYSPWRSGWQPRDIDEYHRALEDLTPDAVELAVTEAIRTRRTPPSASQLRDIIIEQRACTAQALLDHRQTNVGDGQGCPDCRHERGDQVVDSGSHEPWRGDGKLIYCETHRVAWHGTNHNPYADDDT